MPSLIVARDIASASSMVADNIQELLRKKPGALLGLPTGGTVMELYGQLVRRYNAGSIDFSRARIVNIDEYVGLSAGHPRSMANFLHSNLISKTNITKDNIMLLDGSDAAASLLDYTSYLNENEMDYLLLGVGANGHVAFNEPDDCLRALPHTVRLSEQTIKSNSVHFTEGEQVPSMAMTIGAKHIVSAKKVTLMAFGQAKAQAIKAFIQDDGIRPGLPCSMLKLCGDAEIIVDEELARSAGIAD